LLASTCSRGLCRLPSASTAEVILNTIATPRWRPARASWPPRPPRSRPAHRRARGVVDSFVACCAGDDRINWKFGRTNIPHLKKNLADQSCDTTGRPWTYTGRSRCTTG
jgi:hypothetical protein